MTSLSLQSDDTPPDPGRNRGLVVLLALLVACTLGLGYFAYRLGQRTAAVEQQLAVVSSQAEAATARAQQAYERASVSETAARAAAEGRQVAEVQTADARQKTEAAQQEATSAKEEATSAKETAAQARAEADGIRKKAEAEVNRLETALGQIAETRRTALGLIMNLGGDHLKFEFNKADLQPADRELLARIAGIMLTSQDYTISVNGHTDDVGSEAYNQKLSERRAQAVRDYLVQAGLPAGILSVQGYGKSVPRVPGSTDAARAKNRRVELGIVNTRIRYGR